MATKQARWGISLPNIFSLTKPICNNCFSNSFCFLINKIIWLFSRFLCFVVFRYSFSHSFVSFLVIHCYFLVFRPRIARVLCFLRWTEQIAYLFLYFSLSKKNCNMFARLVGHHPRIMFCLIVFSFAILLCFLLQYSCTIVSFSLVGFKPFFPFSFFSGFI